MSEWIFREKMERQKRFKEEVDKEIKSWQLSKKVLKLIKQLEMKKKMIDFSSKLMKVFVKEIKKVELDIKINELDLDIIALKKYLRLIQIIKQGNFDRTIINDLIDDPLVASAVRKYLWKKYLSHYILLSIMLKNFSIDSKNKI